MTTPHRIPKFSRFCVVAASSWCLVGSLLANDSWWNEAWTQRQNITLDTSGMADSIGDATVLVRLSEGRFNFQAAREDGSDIRFVAADGTTVLPHQVESYDGVLNEAFVWVRVPALKGGGKETIHLYYGNRDAAMPAAGKPTDVYGKEISAVHHFGQAGRAPMDATANANHAAAPATTAESAVIGNGLRLLGNNPVTIPNSATLAWTQGQDLTLQLWLKPAALQDESVVFSRSEGTSSLRLILNQGVPAVEITDGSSRQRSQAGSALPAAAWHHLAVVAGQGKVQLLVDGEPYASLNAVIPALAGPIILGAAEPAVNGLNGFTGEMDEFRIQASALSTAAVRFAAANQGLGEDSARVVVLGEIEGGESGGGGSKALEHVLLFGDIAKNMMFDGWIAVGLCMVMIVIGWTVAIRKFFYLNQIEKGNREFLKLWKSVSTDLTALDHADAENMRTMGGSIAPDDQERMRDSPLYQIYHIGSAEISHRLKNMSEKNKIEGLPGRSIQAIRASLDAGLVHENHRLSDGLVYLTISIAGGPYVGLLGTVVGVMITFAIIAKNGEVNVNSIAPGIASALLATVAGLIVAIPALFIYSYLNSRIKTTVSTMQVFIDEFVAKMAEFYRPQSEPDHTGANL